VTLVALIMIQPSIALLKAHYPFVYSLRVYLSQILEDTESVSDDDSDVYRQFVYGTYVALKEEVVMRLRVGSPMMYMRDVRQPIPSGH
jgi:hypothetical protein